MVFDKNKRAVHDRTFERGTHAVAIKNAYKSGFNLSPNHRAIAFAGLTKPEPKGDM